MSDVEDVLARLRAETELTSRQGFTLDRARAREKMREFQLADPRRWVLLLVRAAIMRGATRVAVDIDRTGLSIAFDGAPLTAADFEELYASMFAAATDRMTRSRRELALACNAAMALGPRRLRVESGDGESGHAIELVEGHDDVITALPAGRRGTLVRQDDRLRVAVLDLLAGDQASRPERELLRAGCSFAEAHIVLDGARISGGLAALRAWGTTELESPWTGRCGFVPEGGANQLVVLQFGVVLARRTIDELPAGLVVVVEGTDLRTDVSRNEPVQDDDWHALISVVARAADRALAAVARERASELPPWLVTVMRTRLARHGAVEVEVADANMRSIAAVPMWRCVDRRRVSTLDLAASSSVRYVTPRDLSGPVPSGHADVLLVGVDELQALRAVQPRASGCAAELAHAQRRERERVAARARPHAVELSADGWVVQHELERDGVRVVLGVPSRPSEATNVRWVSGGYLLCEGAPPLAVPVVAIVGAALTPNERSDAPIVDAALVHALDVLAQAFEELVERLARRLLDDVGCRREHLTRLRAPLLGHLHAWVTGALVHHLHGAVGCDARAIAALPSAREAALPPRLESHRDHPLFALPLLDTRGSDDPAAERMSITELHADTACPIVRDEPRGALQSRVVVADAATCALLGRLLGAHRLEERGEDSAEVERAQFLARPQIWSARRPKLALGPIEVEQDGVTCSLGVRAGVEDPREPARVVVLRERRQLTELQWPSPIAGLDAIVSADDLAPNRDWTGLADGAGRARVSAVVATAVERLVEAALRGDAALEAHRRVLSAAACAVAARTRPVDGVHAELTAACERHGSELLARPLFAGHTLGALLACDVDDVPRERWRWWDRVLLRGVLEAGALDARSPASEPVVERDAPTAVERALAEIVVGAPVAGVAVTSPTERASIPETTPQAAVEPVAGAIEPPPPAQAVLEVPAPAASEPEPPEPVTESAPQPAPEPAPGEASPIDRVLADVRAVLRAIRDVDATWAGDPRLDRLVIQPLEDFALARVDGDHVVLNRIHPVTVAAIAADPTPALCVHLLASAVFTAVNTWSEAILDADELRFLAAHASVACRGPSVVTGAIV